MTGFASRDRVALKRLISFQVCYFHKSMNFANAATHVVIICEVVPLLFDRPCVSLCAAGELLGSSERRLTQTMASFIREKLYVAQHKVISIQILSNPIYRLEKKTHTNTGLDFILLTMCKVYISNL